MGLVFCEESMHWITRYWAWVLRQCSALLRSKHPIWRTQGHCTTGRGPQLPAFVLSSACHHAWSQCGYIMYLCEAITWALIGMKLGHKMLSLLVIYSNFFWYQKNLSRCKNVHIAFFKFTNCTSPSLHIHQFILHYSVSVHSSLLSFPEASCRMKSDRSLNTLSDRSDFILQLPSGGHHFRWSWKTFRRAKMVRLPHNREGHN